MSIFAHAPRINKTFAIYLISVSMSNVHTNNSMSNYHFEGNVVVNDVECERRENNL